MYPKAERFPVVKTPDTTEVKRRQKQTQTHIRAGRLDRRNRIKEITERWERHFRRRNWVKPFLRICKSVQVLPVEDRIEAWRRRLQFDKIPKVLLSGEIVQFTPTPIQWNLWSKPEIKKIESESLSVHGDIESVQEVDRPELKEETGSVFTFDNIVKTLFGEGPSTSAVETIQQVAVTPLPYVPITIPMRDKEHRTTNVAPLPIFYGRTGSDTD